MTLRPRGGDSSLESGRGAGSRGFNRGGRELEVRNMHMGNEFDMYVELGELVLVMLPVC